MLAVGHRREPVRREPRGSCTQKVIPVFNSARVDVDATINVILTAGNVRSVVGGQKLSVSFQTASVSHAPL